MKKSRIFAFSIMAFTTIAMVLFTFSCKKEEGQAATENSFSEGCDFSYSTEGYIVQEDGILNFQDAGAFFAFIDTVPQWSDSAFVVWETGTGSNTAYGNYIEADNALTTLMTPYENDTVTTDADFLPIFDSFIQSKAHLASITDEGVEPYFSFPFYYFVNGDGIYRICDQEFSIQGSLLLSYPVGKQDLVAGWNGEVGEFGELSVQQIKKAHAGGEIHDRDEEFHPNCTATLDGNSKKRIKVWWDSSAFRQQNIEDPLGGPNVTGYFWAHQAEIKAQKKSFWIWWSDTRHIALSVTGTIVNRHQHEVINTSRSHPVSFFKCERARNIKEKFASEFFVHSINSNLNNFALSLTVTGTNRRDDCQTIQASCTMNILNN